MDLLNLARTCKSLRGLLMHKSSLFLWKTALDQIKGLPGCPADLDEPEYTNLVFYARCHVSTDSSDCSKPECGTYRAAVNRRKLFSGTCAAGIARPAELNGMALWMSQQRLKAHIASGFAIFISATRSSSRTIFCLMTGPQ